MTGAEFVARVKAHPNLQPGTGPNPEMLYLVYLHDDVRLGWEITPSTVLEHDWETLEAVFTGRRRALIMNHISRIVGYYSNMRNWNPSKVAEARDRRLGAYALPE